MGEMLRDRIVFGTNSTKAREKLINVGAELTYDKAVQIAQSCEYSPKQLKSMAEDISVNAVKSKRRQQKVSHSNKSRSRFAHGTAQKTGSQHASRDTRQLKKVWKL